MIQVKDKQMCCGCSACEQICPKRCISMLADEEGFLYPSVDINDCIDCHLCEKVCPILNQGESRKPLGVYAAKNRDEEIRMNSSSGGVFTALAERVIENGGVVFGAKFNEAWDVIHDYTETKKGLVVFRGSKYVQSKMGDNYKKAEVFLKEGREVLFSGTPCQIAGLKRYLRKEYSNLLAVDFICHGVPSPEVWKKYLDETIARQCDKNSVSSDSKSLFSVRDAHVEGISFRDKRLGWKKFSFALTLSTTDGSGAKNTVSLNEVMTKNVYLRGFLQNLYLRPSCGNCSFKNLKSGSDITLADFWNVERYMDLSDGKGISLLLIGTNKGEDCIKRLNIDLFESSYEVAVTVNPAIEKSSTIHWKRELFFQKYASVESITQLIEKMIHRNKLQKMMSFIRRVINRLKFEFSRL